MDTIYHELIDAVENGESFRVDLKERSMKVGKIQVIKEGRYNSEQQLIEFDGDVWAVIEDLYFLYKHSMPSERGEHRRSYFKALSVSELSDDDMVFGEEREVARARLEGFILCMVILGKLEWPNEKHWFYRGQDHDLIILKKWF